MKVIIISGATATGKTDIGLALARRYGGEIVNFDSLLLYREINIGTAKPEARELQEIPHHMINVRSITEPMNAADYAAAALPIVEQLLSEKKIVYLVGGSGFYLQALLKGMYHSPTTTIEIQKRSDELYQAEGITPFLRILQQQDPESHDRYHANDHYRIRRAVEHWWSTGTKFSTERLRKEESNKTMSSASIHPWQVLHLYLDVPKEEHLAIIQQRTKRMLDQGLLAEVDGLLESGFSGKEKPIQSIGYREILEYRAGNFDSIEACQERIIISTRQLAKAQRTWFKKENSRKEFHPLRQRDLLFAEVEKFLIA